MRALRVIAVLWLTLASGTLWAADTAKPAITVEEVLVPGTARAAHLGSLVDSVAVTPDGVVVVGNGDRLWRVGASGARRIDKVRGLRSFAFTPEGLLIGVSGRRLVYVNPHGVLKTFFILPAASMNIVPGVGDTIFLFGPEGHGHYGLYRLQPGRKVSKVLGTNRPITSVAQSGKDILLVAGGVLYGVSNGRLRLVAGEAKGKLVSVAADNATGRIFVSDGAHIFQIDKGQAVPLFGGLGGTLRWYGGGLLVLDAKRELVVRLLGSPVTGR